MKLKRNLRNKSEENVLTIDEILIPYFKKPVNPIIEDIRKLDRDQMEEPEVEYISLED